ncbi:MAG: hypothetical protein LBK83_06235 [Treponema sp.]|jgi:hypothetical protein|nr:hypothetical protein [Treponema sp.]
MNTGEEVKINNGTLVIATTSASDTIIRGGYISIFEFKNGKWIEKKTFDTKKYFKEPYQAPMNAGRVESRSFLDAGDNIIALIASSARIFRENDYDKAILIFKKSGNEWTHLDTIYKNNLELSFYGYFIRGYYGTNISVDRNTVIVPVTEKGIRVFEIHENETEEYLIPDEFNVEAGVGIIRNNTIILSEIFYDDHKKLRRVKVYNRSGGNWELAFIFDENSFPEIWTKQDGPGIYIGILDDSNLYVGSDHWVYFFKKDDYGYTVTQSIDISIKDGERWAPIMDLVIKDGIMAYARGKKLYIYHNINDTWNLTDTIDLKKLQLNGRFIDDVKLDISNDILVIGFDNVRKDLESSDMIAIIPYPPFWYKRNPGSVYILKIHPNGGYEIQGIITRKYNLFGKVKFVNKK